MRQDSFLRGSPPVLSVRNMLLVFFFMAAAVLAMTWPWATHFASGFIAHWDPPFHAWKLQYVADAILDGRLLPPDANTNMYYPNTGALYYEALHWPQAVFAALLSLFTDNTILVYHITFLAFWAFSGLCMWMFLAEMGATRAAALAGALAFTIMPYRMAYVVEFNMQLCFGVPLFLFFMLRYFSRPGIGPAAGMAVALCMQAASELYQAVFLVMLLPFLALPLLRRDIAIVKSARRFWVPVAVAAAIAILTVALLLAPYMQLLGAQTVVRRLHEVRTHSLEVFTYLASTASIHFLPGLKVKLDETSVYPTLPVLIAGFAGLAWVAYRRFSEPGAFRRIETALRMVRMFLLISFFILAADMYFRAHSKTVAALVGWLPVVVVLMSLVIPVFMAPSGRRILREYVMEGLFGGAVFAYFMSLGPAINFVNSRAVTSNQLYLALYKASSMLHGFRVVSRFSFFVLIFLVAAFALCLTDMMRSERIWKMSIPVLLVSVALIALESWRPIKIKYFDIEMPVSTHVLDDLDSSGKPYVLAMAPMGFREIDSQHMLQIAGSRRLFVYAWGGTYPDYTTKVQAAISGKRANPEKAHYLLSQLWPECYILEDKTAARVRGPFQSYRDAFSGVADVVAEDAKYALMRLRPTGPATNNVRIVRTDMLEDGEAVSFALASAAPGRPVHLSLNGRSLGEYDSSPATNSYRVALPGAGYEKTLPNRFVFESEDPIFLSGFSIDR